jgi:hypothetical protein
LNKSHSAGSALSLRSARAQLSVTTQSLRARLEGEGGPDPGLMVFEARRSDMGTKAQRARD